eukprot:3644666-Prorocentrum_lima.AAC.1
MIRRPPRSTHCISSAASDVYKRQGLLDIEYDMQLPELEFDEPHRPIHVMRLSLIHISEPTRLDVI